MWVRLPPFGHRSVPIFAFPITSRVHTHTQYNKRPSRKPHCRPSTSVWTDDSTCPPFLPTSCPPFFPHASLAENLYVIGILASMATYFVLSQNFRWRDNGGTCCVLNHFFYQVNVPFRLGKRRRVPLGSVRLFILAWKPLFGHSHCLL